MDSTDGFQELSMHLSLQQVSSRPCLESSYHLSVASVSGQDDDPGIWEFLLDLMDRLNAIQPVHLNVHQGYIRSVRPKLLDGFFAIRGLCNQLHVTFSVDQCGDPLTEERMVVHGKDPDQARIDAHDCVPRNNLILARSGDFS